MHAARGFLLMARAKDAHDLQIKPIAALSTSDTLLNAAIAHRNLRYACADPMPCFYGVPASAPSLRRGVFLVPRLALRYNPRIPDRLTRNA